MSRSSFLVVVAFVLAAGPAVAGVGSLQVALESGPYRFVDRPTGRTIEMEGFDYLKVPGRPMIPEREILVLLPPGARALSVEVEELESKPLPGNHRLTPTPSMLPLSGAYGSPDLIRRDAAKWNAVRRAAYSDDRAYPTEVAGIVGAGTLRKYSYARIAFRPFTYHAASGRLVHHPSARARIHFATPDPGSEEALISGSLLADTLADQRAAELFVNYEDLRASYELGEPSDSPAAPPQTTHDFLIVTTPQNVGAVDASGFAAWKASLGFDVRTVLTTDREITRQPGADLAEQIRNFLRDNYVSWGIEFVLLVGNYNTVPMRYCYPDPSNHLHNPADPGTGPGSVPTDAYYADLSFSDADSWDLDGDGFYGEYGQDSPDFFTEVAVGRIPTNVPSRITYTLDKLVRVEQDNGAWKRHALHAGAILFFENQNGQDIPLRDGAVFVNEVEAYFMQGWSMSRYSEQSGLVTSSFPWPPLTLQAFIQDWNDGTYGIVNWAGHGWPDGVYRTVWSWDDGDGVPETDGSDGMDSEAFITDPITLDDDYPGIVCAVSCDVGYPEPNNSNGNLGVDLLSDPTMGAAAGVVSASRYAAVSRDWPALPGGAESLCYEFNRYLIAGPGGARRLGPALYESKLFAHVNYGWEMSYEYRNMYNYNLYGDPSMDWRGAGPRTGNLLRDTEVWQLDPVEPPLSDCLPLDPTISLYIPDFVAGSVDPDSDNPSPLVFYAIDAPVRIWLELTPAGEIRIDF